ncbi:hypothetical protein EVG20_g7002 [Dentipellis fragilis]|uniref:Uncharacterized protein n=1 Tax=Dentipellis fragilis TaxID=205917 RepID=A0A4Y9YGV2_9AGAM|nr:hypothetical protein EVG20_g7002 [Dentipellis fragilis]
MNAGIRAWGRTPFSAHSSLNVPLRAPPENGRKGARRALPWYLPSDPIASRGALGQLVKPAAHEYSQHRASLFPTTHARAALFPLSQCEMGVEIFGFGPCSSRGSQAQASGAPGAASAGWGEYKHVRVRGQSSKESLPYCICTPHRRTPTVSAMVALLRLASFVALVAAANAARIHDRDARAPAACANPSTVSSDTVTVDGKDVVRETIACSTVTPAIVSGKPLDPDVCGGACTTTCGRLGDLPPSTDDCQTIKNAIAIFAGSAPANFTVQPDHVEQLTFGTCRFFFENLTGDEVLTYCWQDLANSGSAAASDCFPPVQPVQTLATCTSLDGTWALGVSHS